MTMQNHLIPSDAVAVTPSDTTFVNLVRLYVGGTGDVTVQGSGGNSVLFKACPVGCQLEMLITRVMATGTTATLLTGFTA